MKFYEALSKLDTTNEIRRPRWSANCSIRLGIESDLLTNYANDVHEIEDGDIDFDDLLSDDWIVESQIKKAPKVEEFTINSILEQTEFSISTLFDKVTVISAKLPNGFVITESSGAVSSENYDEQIGVSICKERIKNKIWELEGYKLASEVAGGSYDEHDGIDFGNIFATHAVHTKVEM